MRKRQKLPPEEKERNKLEKRERDGEKRKAEILSLLPTDNAICWTGLGYLKYDGYRCLSYKAETWSAHRLVYTFLIGPIPDGMTLDHLCRNRACCNPKHLECVTQQENVLRGEGLTAKHAAKTHCVQGHELTPENTSVYAYKYGKTRVCKICKRAAIRKYKEKNKHA